MEPQLGLQEVGDLRRLTGDEVNDHLGFGANGMIRARQGDQPAIAADPPPHLLNGAKLILPPDQVQVARSVHSDFNIRRLGALNRQGCQPVDPA